LLEKDEGGVGGGGCFTPIQRHTTLAHSLDKDTLIRLIISIQSWVQLIFLFYSCTTRGGSQNEKEGKNKYMKKKKVKTDTNQVKGAQEF